jgi:rhomboid protease GluP
MAFDPNASPFNRLPPVIIALAAVIGGIELLFLAADYGFLGAQRTGARIAALQGFSFFDPLFDDMLSRQDWSLDGGMRLFSYALVQRGWLDTVFVLVFILAIGNLVGQVFHPLAVVALFLLSSAFGALVFGLVLDTRVPLMGGFPGVFGLIGAYTFLLWVSLAGSGTKQFQAFQLIAFFMGIRLVFGVLLGADSDWVAELAAFVFGFLASFILSPGGWHRVLDKLRR